MPEGACVIRYDGKRGVVWRIKYADAGGKQVMQTLGPERDGWNRKKADAELRERLVRVERKNYRRPRPITFDAYARTWREECEGRRKWSVSTVKIRRLQVDRLPATWRGFTARLEDVVQDVHVPVHGRRRERLHHLSDVLRPGTGRRTRGREARGARDANPVEGAERPKIERKRWRILEPVEVGGPARRSRTSRRVRLS